ncbi:MAG: hypothetical protein JSS96_12605, partial [Bacteroidetes bacterium]|nr:hypothetical protein [Bacteroidota bacterium]
MKKYSLLLFILIFCAFKREPYYKHIKAKDAAKYKCADDVYRGKDIQILRCFDAKGYERLIVQRHHKKGVEYFLLKLFAKFEPDSSIRWYEPPFIVSTESENQK